MGEDLYGDFKKAFLHRDAAVKFERAVNLLQQTKPGWSFIIYDALRPRSVQWKMWAKVKNTSDENYIANPEKGSTHNFGMALDLGLLDEKGSVVDMGAGFDQFDEISEPLIVAEGNTCNVIISFSKGKPFWLDEVKIMSLK